MAKITLSEKLALFDTHWDPKVVAGYNGDDVMVVKVLGKFPFHAHDDTDDLFLILEGEVVMDYEDGPSETLRAGDLCVVPRGRMHRPRAAREAKVLLIEPRGTPNTGDPATAAAKDRI
ncbi:cupin domain-containing protein [Jannaschia sp. Os4]|uniref:cupin domain-containing protein n=1 Tax=Jannaschia sp. Os4 TaxID=2807617 RepID=UPI00193A68D1|nr:cupin domain-containing protein [Jannaschia sp. Os4]MBM2576002.1 cupin domain-containing protein [Jannaschia sp. Os4]